MSGDRRWHWAALGFLLVSTAVRLTQLSVPELAPDEAYYWDWSRHLALGYYDQGPMIAYVIRLTTALLGTNEFGVRFGVLLASLGTLLCVYGLARRVSSPLAGFLAVVALGLTPLMEVGSLIATYDPLLVFFWALAVLCLERALFAPSARSQRAAWLYAGAATGLGFLSKHTMLLLLPCLLLFLALSPPHRHWLRRPQPYVACLLVLLLYSGVFWWNAQHHWWTFRHLLFLTAKAPGTPPLRVLDFLGSQALLLGPALFIVTLYTSYRALHVWRRPTAVASPSLADPQALFLLCMGLPVFAFFCLMALKAKVQGNWAPCAWLTPTVLWAAWMAEWAEHSRQAVRTVLRRVGFVALTGGLLTVLMASPALRERIGIHLPPSADPSNTAYGWRQLAAHVQQMRQEMEQDGRRKVFIAGNGYQYVALMAFYLPDHPATYDLFLHFRLTMYAAYVGRTKALLGQDAIFINDGEVDDQTAAQAGK